jgi:rod shape-determining protein MreC
MAPPSPRRPGFSKRAQLSLFSAYVVAVTGALVGLLLVVTARVDPRGNAAIQTFLGDIFAPVSGLARGAVMAFSSAGDGVSAYLAAASKNKAMATELATARRKLIEGRVAELENKRLKRAVRLVEQVQKPLVTARLVSSTGASSRRYAILGAGAGQGVTLGATVLAPDGLVGRVAAVGRSSARILLIIDSETVVPVKRLSDGTPSLVIGKGDGTLEVRALAAGLNPFRVRDILVTSGTGGVFRPGIPVAIVTSSTKERTQAVPLASPARYDFGIVEQEFLEAPPLPAGDLPRASN